MDTIFPRVIQSHITIDYIKGKLDDVNEGENNELHYKFLLQLSVLEPHIDVLKKYDTGFSIANDEKILVGISDSALRLLLPPQLQNMTPHCQIMCGYKIFIQSGTYQESINH